MIKQGRIFVELDRSCKNRAFTIPQANYHQGIKLWSFPIKYMSAIKSLFPQAVEDIENSEKVYNSELSRRPPEVVNKSTPKKATKYDLDKRIAACPDPDIFFKLKPYEHQMRMLKAGLIFKKFAFFCEMGTGKTKVGIDIIAARKKYNGLKRALVFAPKSVVPSWAGEVDKNSDMSYTICTGTKKQKLVALQAGVDIVITNYETVVGIQDEKIWKAFDLVILDESSRIKNHQAKRTKLLTKLFYNTSYKYIMSGTPITQNPTDIYAQYNFLNKDILGFKSFYSFRNTHCVMGGFQKYQIVGFKEMDALRYKISTRSLQLKKEDCLDLPEKIYETRQLTMSAEMTKQYKAMKNDMVLELEGEEDVTAQIVLTKMLRLQEILSGVYIEGKYNEKLKELMEIVNEAMENGRQVVIWARFRKTLDTLCKAMEEAGYTYSLIHGGINNRGEQIDKFQSGEHKVFIGQERTGGLGITLHAGDLMVYYENTFSLEDRKQSEDRIHRIGQKNNCLYIDLVYKGTIDTQVLKAIQNKQDIAHYLVDSFKEGKYGTRKKKV